MRWSSRVVVIVMVALAIGVVREQGLPLGALAQESTPAANDQAGAADTVTNRTLASGSVEVLAPGTIQLGLGRLALAPGSSLSIAPADPSAVLVYATAGELTFVVDVPMTVARRVEPGTPEPTEPEAVEAKTEFNLRDGDSALFPPTIAGEVRNDGAEEATALVVNLVVVTPAESTPTP